MKLEDQVCSLELAKRLKELGVKQESAFCWAHPWEPYTYTEDKSRYILTEPRKLNIREGIVAFTAAELGEMLPGHIGMNWFLQFWKSDFSGPASFSINYKDPKTEGNPETGWMRETIIEKTEANARARMLIHLLENKIITPEAVNKGE